MGFRFCFKMGVVSKGSRKVYTAYNETPTIDWNPMNQDQKKQKLAQIKQKIKAVAPAAIAFTAATASVVLTINAVKNASQKVDDTVDDEPFREVTGEEKTTLLGRDDIVIQEADPGTFYFISVVQPKIEE